MQTKNNKNYKLISRRRFYTNLFFDLFSLHFELLLVNLKLVSLFQQLFAFLLVLLVGESDPIELLLGLLSISAQLWVVANEGFPSFLCIIKD